MSILEVLNTVSGIQKVKEKEKLGEKKKKSDLIVQNVILQICRAVLFLRLTHIDIKSRWSEKNAEHLSELL